MGYPLKTANIKIISANYGHRSQLSHLYKSVTMATGFYNSLYGWQHGVVVSGVRRMNEVNPRRAWLVPGWVTVFGRVNHLGM